ncbi:AAA family ATPase [Paraburkholderia strydomiana]|uniref:AAA family ATPase n=1 Tax=Paraburkholderia strydomiana TaxID=1245417 RepID=UPI0038B8DAEC
MSLPDIDFKEIRVHRTSQADAFEELCCQLAGDEPLTDRIRFDKKGRGGDGGIECFATHADGSETGWQVKFYWEIDSLLSSLDGSLTKALVKHPAMQRFIACFPFDLADSRRADVTTAFAKWNRWRERRISEAAAAGRTVALDRWDAHEIKQRLTDSNPRSAGRIAFWFDRELLTADWFRKAFERTADSLGDRYSPQTHIDIPVRQSILATVRDPVIFEALKPLAARIRHSLQQTLGSANNAACTAALGVATELDTLADEQPDSFPLLELRGRIDAAADLATAWHRELRDQRQGRERSPELIAVSNLMNAVRACARNVRADHWAHLETRALLVSGDAGSGKSHLLADACAHQIENGRPAMMVLGGKLPDAEPWGEILRDLDLPRHLQAKQFLGALNAAGEAANVRALVVIDALNEKNGQLIWPERLAGLLNDLRQFPFVTVVLSCRTTYLNAVIPDSLDASKLPRIEHEGFADGDVMRYLRRRGISVPEAPRQLDELHNPLFLRLACDALKAEGEVLVTDSLSGISEAFRLFTSTVTRRIEATTKVSPRRNLVSKAIEALTTEMSRTGRGEVGFERADELVRSIYDGNEMASDILFQLENEGLLAVEQDSFSSVESKEVVRFTFERMGDHAIAASLLNGSMTSEGAGAVCAPGTPLHQALADRHSRIVPGLLEALAIQLPERLDLELPDLADIPSRSWVDEAFVQSLLARQPTAFRDRTWQLVAEMGDERLRFDTLIALSTEPEHPFNVRVLDSELRCLALPQRDAHWSVHLADSDRATTLVDWAWNADQTRVTFARAELAAIQLTWFLTTSFRPLRDRATKALVALLAGRPRLAISLWNGFKNVDDGYLTERLIAALYGAAMQGVWEDHDLSAVATTLYRDLFANRTPPANSLLRDHALGLIAYAMHRGVLGGAIDPEKLNGPFLSPWPIEHVPDETIEAYTRQYGDNRRYPDEIVNSCQDGDFGRYVLDYAVQDWSPALVGTSPLPNALDLRNAWFEEFKVTATLDMIAAHDRLVETIASENPRNSVVMGEARDRVRAAKAVFRAAVGPDMFEEWRERAEYWRAEGMYQSYASQSGPVGFNLAWARRWVVKRAHDLGWSEELHGAFDRQVLGDRNEHSLERIGKKYQWLALYELVARMSDNLERLPDRDIDPLRLRNLDPSLLVDHVAADDWEEVPAKPFWIGAAPELAARTPTEAITWLHSSEDILDGVENVAVTSEDDDRHWLVLTGFKTWRTPTQGMHCEAWRRVASVVVRRTDRDRALELMSAGQMAGPHDVPAAAGGGYRVHLGEFPWRSLEGGQDDWILDWRPVDRSGRRGNRVAIRPTTTEYNAEADGYDGSVSDHINLHLPARWLMDGLGLHLTNGRSIVYQDVQGVTRFMDPSVSTAGESAALVDRDAFLGLLEREGLVAIWTVAGEKNAYGDSAGDGFGGRLTFTRLFYSDGSGLCGRDRLEKFDAPSARQRAAFLGESAADAAEVDDGTDDVAVSHSQGHGIQKS